jgi:Icc protein
MLKSTGDGAPSPASTFMEIAMRDGQHILTWLHIGDLHITTAEEMNYRDLKRIIGLLEGLPNKAIDFVVLPGDNADDGTVEQFDLVRKAVKPLRLPVHILAGDHDFKPHTLDAFYKGLGARELPYAISIGGHRCLFLDVVSAGTGGPDFRMVSDQLAWVEDEIKRAANANERVIIFMHTYPSDLREGTEPLNRMLARENVVCVDMGHTHYNEVANDGRTIFMATRSTGQIEEGPPGFSIAAIDEGAVSWRFKPLDTAWPFVLVTTPIDWRLQTIVSDASNLTLSVRAKVFSDVPIEHVDLKLNDEDWLPMTAVDGEVALWEKSFNQTACVLRVKARDARGREDEDRIELPKPGQTRPVRAVDGSDQNSLAAWPERGIVGTQLGPNRNGKKW